MSAFSRGVRRLGRAISSDRPALHEALVALDAHKERLRHAVGQRVPAVIGPQLRKLTIAVTAHCNLRCVGCRYGRDYMPGSSLPLERVREALDDGHAAGAELVRLYGGEPLLHPDLPAMVRHALELGYVTYVTTNGILLEERIDALYEAGLRDLTIGFYGVGGAYDDYVQRSDRYARLLAGLAAVRDRYGADVRLQLNYLVMRPTAGLEVLAAAWELCERFDMTLHTDLVHYSLPYFVQGRDHELQFQAHDRPAVEALTDELVRLKRADPRRVPEPEASLRSIPDWLFLGPEMRVPCDAYRLLWIGADGSVRLCYVCFPLGNLHERRLAEMIGGPEHRAAARDAFALRCPNCHCERATRIVKHGPSLRRYSG